MKVHFTNLPGRWFTLVENTDRGTLFDVLVLCVFATVVVDVTVVAGGEYPPLARASRLSASGSSVCSPSVCHCSAPLRLFA